MEIKTFEQIMKDMLSRLPDDYDKRQGSLFYNLVAPAAQELAIQYTVLEEMNNTQFLDTSYGDYLTRLASQFGVHRLPATKAVREVHFGEPIPLGTRFSVVGSDYNFRVFEHQGQNVYLLEAEQAGVGPNFVNGSLLNIEPIRGFTSAVIGRVIIPGENEESDEALRKRAIDYINTPTLNGNVGHYLKWANEFIGVGSAIVEPLWNGDNTVRVSITDAEGKQPSDELVDRFQEFLDPSPSGHGLGVAPIGAYVTVVGALEMPIRVELQVEVAELANLEMIHNQISEMITDYLKNTAYQEREIKIYKLLNIADDVPFVKTVNWGLLNGSEQTLPIDPGYIPTLKEVVIHVA